MIASLDRLAARLGGAIRIGTDCWLDTRIGNLRAAVIVRHLPLTSRRIVDVAVFMAESPARRPFDRHVEWHLDGHVLPHLSNGFVFAGCRDGVLYATSFEPRDLEHVVGALWELAMWARLPWRRARWQNRRRRDGLRDWLRDRAAGFAIAAIVVVVVLFWRWIRPASATARRAGGS